MRLLCLLPGRKPFEQQSGCLGSAEWPAGGERPRRPIEMKSRDTRLLVIGIVIGIVLCAVAHHVLNYPPIP